METLIMISANLFGGIVCLVFGLIVRTGKADFLIAGYNTMSKEEQSKWNAKALSRFIGWLLIISSIILLIGCIPILLNIFPFIAIFISWGIFLISIILGMIYMNSSTRFKRMK